MSGYLQAQVALPSVPTVEETVGHHNGSECCGENRNTARVEDQISNSPLVQLIEFSQ